MSTLPQLEHELLRAARRRAAARRLRGRPLAVVLVTTALAAGGATAATQLLKVDEGATARGPYVIERLPDRDGQVCLQYRDAGRRPAYGCGPGPSARQPIGLVVADPRAAPGKRIIYGLVAESVARVSVLGHGSEHVDVTPRTQDGLPSKYFLASVAKTPRIELVAYDSKGQQIARVGSRKPRSDLPRSKDEAVAQGHPIGFAPTAAPVSHFTYRGQPIDPDEAARRQLACTEDEVGVRCYDTEAEMEAAEPTPTGRGQQ